MFLSDGDLRAAIESGKLIIDPPSTIGPTSIELHLDSAEQARVWDIDRLAANNKAFGNPEMELRIARMSYGVISREYLVPPPKEKDALPDAKVVRRDDQIVVRPGGFVLWQTKEVVGTPEINPELICFIDGKSTRSRTGLIAHLTAPTIHAGWSGNVTLEMTNCGPLHLVLHEGDAVAQVTVARITRPPIIDASQYESVTFGQTDVTGAAPGTSPAT